MIKYTTIDRILNSLHSIINESDIIESDVIEWIGEAVEFLNLYEVKIQKISLQKVENHETPLPKGLHSILQIAKYNGEFENNCCSKKIIQEIKNEEVKDLECPKEEKPIICFQDDLTYNDFISTNFYYKKFTPVRLATHSFFNTVVCKEKDLTIYENVHDEYTIVGDYNRKLRFSFKEGYVVISYNSYPIDKNTGYPLIPDIQYAITAITYYVKWRIAEKYVWAGRQGFQSIAQDSEKHWLKYVKSAKSFIKMPKTLDEYQQLLEQSHYNVADFSKYKRFFK